MTARGNFVILSRRVGGICPKHVCDEAGDCSWQALNQSVCAAWRAVFLADKVEKTPEYYVYFKFLRQDQTGKEPAGCAQRLVQRLPFKEVTSVEYVRCRLSWRYTIGRLRFSETRRGKRVYRLRRKGNRPRRRFGGLRSGQAGRFVFRPEPDTHGMVERKFHPYDTKKADPMPPNYRTNLEEKYTWQPQRNRSASVSRLTIIS